MDGSNSNPLPSAAWRRTTIGLYALAGLALLLFVLIAYIGLYNHPCPLDDFENAEWTNYLQIQKDLYMQWSGRYFTNLLLTLDPVHWHSFTAYRAAGILVLICFALCFCAFLSGVLRQYLTISKPLAVLIALATLFVVLNGLSTLVEAFYWYSSAMTYTLATVLLMIWLWIIIRIDRSAERKPTAIQALLSALLIIAIVGSSETSMMLVVGICAAMSYWYGRKGAHSLKRFYLLLLVLSLACGAAVVLAPGTLHRDQVTQRIIWMVFPTWIYYTQLRAILWITEPVFLLWSALLTIVFIRHRLSTPAVNLLTAFLLPFAIAFLLSFLAHYGLGTPPPPRVYNFIYVFFILGWIFFLLHLGTYLGSLNIDFLPALRRPLAIIALILLALMSLNTHPRNNANLYRTTKNLLKGIPQTYNARLNKRYERIAAATTDTVYVPSLYTSKENVLYFHDLDDNPRLVSNRIYARYWGKATVYVVDSSSKYLLQQ